MTFTKIDYNSKEIQEKIKLSIKNNISIAGVLRDLGLITKGGNYRTIKKFIQEFNIDTSHFTGQAYLRGKTHKWGKRKPLADYLVDNIWLSTTNIKFRLLDEKVLDEVCKLCGLGPEWNGQKLSLHLDHINGKSNDYRLENLRLLCPNCHSQTETFCGRGNKERKPHFSEFYGPVQEKYRSDIVPRIVHEKPLAECLICGKKCFNKYCSYICMHAAANKIQWPTKEELEKMVWSEPTQIIAQKIGVSDSAIKKRCKKWGIKKPERGYWQKMYAGKINIDNNLNIN